MGSAKKAVKSVTKSFQGITKSALGAVGGLFGKMPEMAAMAIQIPAPEAAKQELVDQQGMISAKEALEKEKLRKGRKALRTDLAVGSSAQGAGVAI